MPLTLGNKLRDLVTLVQPTGSLDGQGRPTYSVYADHVNAGIEDLPQPSLPQQDTQTQRTQPFLSSLRTRITVRYKRDIQDKFFQSGISSSLLVQHKGRTYTVEQIVDPEIPTRGAFLELWVKMINEGMFNQQIKIQKRTATNAYGQQGGAWSDVVTIWARAEQLSGREIINNVEYAAEANLLFVTRYFAGVEPRMRIVQTDSAGKVHYSDILDSSDEERRGVFLVILAKEIISA